MAAIRKVNKKRTGVLLGSGVQALNQRQMEQAASGKPTTPQYVDTSSLAGIQQASGPTQTQAPSINQRQMESMGGGVPTPTAPAPQQAQPTAAGTAPQMRYQPATPVNSFDTAVAAGQGAYDDRNATLKAAAAQAQANAQAAASRVVQPVKSEYVDPYDQALAEYRAAAAARGQESTQLFGQEQAKLTQLLAGIQARTAAQQAQYNSRLSSGISNAGLSIAQAQQNAQNNVAPLSGQAGSSLSPEILAQAAAMAQANAATNGQVAQNAANLSYLRESNNADDSFASKFGQSFQAQQANQNALLFGNNQEINRTLTGRTNALDGFYGANNASAKTYGDLLATGDELNIGALDKATAENPYLMEAIKQYSAQGMNDVDNQTTQRGQDLNAQVSLANNASDNSTELTKTNMTTQAEIQMNAAKLWTETQIASGAQSAETARNDADNYASFQQALAEGDQSAQQALAVAQINAQTDVQVAGINASASITEAQQKAATKAAAPANAKYMKGGEYLATRTQTMSTKARTYYNDLLREAKTQAKAMGADEATVAKVLAEEGFGSYGAWGGFGDKTGSEILTGYYQGGYAAPKASGQSAASGGPTATKTSFSNTPATAKSGGSRSWRNNNPGNIEYGKFAKSKGAIGSDGRFAIFPTEEAGHKAQVALLSSSSYNSKTLGGAIARWAPAFENNVGAYVAAVRRYLPGVTANTPMSQIDKSAMAKAMAVHEGWKPGKIKGSQPVYKEGTRTAATPPVQKAGTPANYKKL